MVSFTQAFDAMLSGARVRIVDGPDRVLYYSRKKQMIVQNTDDYGEIPWLFCQGHMFSEWEIIRMEEE